jgi:excinuclease ABC subunit C
MNKKELTSIPKLPGCYLFKNGKNQVIYVGKAKNLLYRVRSYFAKNTDLSPAKKIMVTEIQNIETIIVSNEVEALYLENTLIKKYLPKYNIDLKDDKNFVYLKITKEKIPQVLIVRQIESAQADYFGPYLSARFLRLTLAIFLRQGQNSFRREFNEAEYLATVNQITNFFKGHTSVIIQELKNNMEVAATKQLYELAEIYHKRLQAIEKILVHQKVISTVPTNQDLISLFSWQQFHVINLFRIRQGKLTDKLNLLLKTNLTSPGDILSEFINHFYERVYDMPKEIIVNEKNLSIKQVEPIINNRCKITNSPRKNELKLLQLGKLNAQNYLSKKIPSFLQSEKNQLTSLWQLQQALQLNRLPQRIECFDISHIQGRFAVGSMVVFTDGLPDKNQYRKFKIKYTIGINDFAMMSEIIARRVKHTQWPYPNLILIDGGKGQLSAVNKTLYNFKLKFPTAAIAKKNEELFIPKQSTPIRLSKNNEGLKLVQRIRDEAHRFAITYYRQSHQTASIRSKLDNIPDIGRITRKKITQNSLSIKNISQLSPVKLAKLVGRDKAKKLKHFIKHH